MTWVSVSVFSSRTNLKLHDISVTPKMVKKATNFMAPFYGQGSIASRLQKHFKEAVYFLPLSLQKSLVLILVALEG